MRILGKECLSRRQQLPTIFNLPLETLSVEDDNNTCFFSVNQTGSRLHITIFYPLFLLSYWINSEIPDPICYPGPLVKLCITAPFLKENKAGNQEPEPHNQTWHQPLLQQEVEHRTFPFTEQETKPIYSI